MAYQAIYRKWRPQIFEDIVGQTHITNTLKNQIMNNRVSHAYLFCGTRGTGKTTAAKVLSKAVNCLNPQNGSPCNQCDICRGIQDGSIMDVTEIDAASNNGVDNIRELRDDVNFVATQTKYRVYIIDEVHMLSTGAFNALLKTLEEPPGHVIFILATTEVHKIPETILSRCQRFDFKRITPSDIIVRMKEIAAADGISITDEAFSLLAQLADGSMRDGLSILERCVSACGTVIDRDDITNVLGMVENDLIFKIADSVITDNTENAINSLEMLTKEGKNLNVFCDSLIKHFRDLLICKVSQNPSGLLDYSDEILVKIKAQAEKSTYEKLSNAATVLTKAKADAKWVKNPRVIYELALMKLTRPELDDSKEALLDRLAAVEEKAKNGIVVKEVQAAENIENNQKKKTEVSARLFAPIDLSKLNSESHIVKIAKNWEKISASMVSRHNYIVGCIAGRKITIDGEGILLLFGDGESAMRNLAVKYLEQIQNAFKLETGSEYKIKPVFIKDVEDVIIDYWNLPQGTASEYSSGNVSVEKKSNSDDPLDNLTQDYPEIVVVQDESDADMAPVSSSMQQDLFEDGNEEDREEFLETNEVSDSENVNEYTE